MIPIRAVPQNAAGAAYAAHLTTIQTATSSDPDGLANSQALKLSDGEMESPIPWRGTDVRRGAVDLLRVLELTPRLLSPAKPWYYQSMALIEIEDQIAKALRAQADIRDMTLEAFLRRIAEMAAPINSTPEFSTDEFDRSIAEVSFETPVLPDGFSRADLYVDHD